MTVTLERSPLDDALEIPGARVVALLDAVDGGTVLWWAGASSLGEQEAAAAIALAVAAAGLVRLTDPDDDLGDVLVTSAAAFHVLRLLDDGTRVAHLMLRRAGANLAMARHDFKLLIDAHTGRARHTAGPAPMPAPAPVPAAALPRRWPGQPGTAGQAPPDDDDDGRAEPPGWFTLMGQPYQNDERVLDRILVSLRHL
jgi:hypothetical protein